MITFHSKFSMSVLITIFLYAIMHTLPGLCAEQSTTSQVWSFGISGLKHTLKSGDGYDLIGTSTEVQIGYGSIGEKGFILASIDVLSGPFQAEHQNTLVLDFSGTGMTFTMGYSADELGLRSTSGNYGFILGLSYADIIGRPIGESKAVVENESVDKFVMRTTNFSLVPGVFFCWLQPKRASGNTRELLKTRIEGYFLNLSIAVPLKASYRVDRTKSLFLREDTGLTHRDSESLTVKETGKGELLGNTIILSFTALLGV